jgi:hypothetical protein
MVAATSPIIPIPFPYFGVGAEELAVRFRIGIDDDRFRWKSGTKPCTASPKRRRRGMVVLIEGESNCHTLWFQRIPALGIPGARIAMLDT